MVVYYLTSERLLWKLTYRTKVHVLPVFAYGTEMGGLGWVRASVCSGVSITYTDVECMACDVSRIVISLHGRGS